MKIRRGGSGFGLSHYQHNNQPPSRHQYYHQPVDFLRSQFTVILRNLVRICRPRRNQYRYFFYSNSRNSRSSNNISNSNSNTNCIGNGSVASTSLGAKKRLLKQHTKKSISRMMSSATSRCDRIKYPITVSVTLFALSVLMVYCWELPYYEYVAYIKELPLSAANLFSITVWNAELDEGWEEAEAMSKIAQMNFIAERKLISLEVAQQSCRYPVLNPWDPSLLGLLRHPLHVRCRPIQDDFSYIDEYGHLHLNVSTISAYVQQPSGLSAAQLSNCSARAQHAASVTCSFTQFDRVEEGSDMVATFSKEQPLRPCEPVPLEKDFVMVQCKTASDRLVYMDFHAHPSNSTPSRPLAQPSDSQLSVLLFILDSLSLSLMRRNLPLTYEYLRRQQDFVVFEGMHKVGDNTFANMVPLLSGLRATEEQVNMPMELGMDVALDHFDRLPLIWRNFSASGYETTFLEDWPRFGLFQFAKQGFCRKPTDHFYFTYWKAVLNHTSSIFTDRFLRHSSKFCLGSRPTLDIHLDIVRRHLWKSMRKNTLAFTYAFYTDLSHDSSDDVQRGDAKLRQFFEELYERSPPALLNKTVVLFMGDHGSRFGAIRETEAGWFEDRRPALLLKLPEWVYSKYPRLASIIASNRYRPTSHFDVHEILVDILRGNLEPDSRRYPQAPSPMPSHGLSLFSDLPQNRTCFDAGIPAFYCTCLQAKPVSVDSDVAKMSASALVSELNSALANHSSRCEPLVLSDILSVSADEMNAQNDHGLFQSVLQLSAKMGAAVGTTTPSRLLVRIVVRTNPGGGKFEALMEYMVGRQGTPADGSGTQVAETRLFSDISRLNAYAEQSGCMEHAVLRKYCYCR